jgi:hypothetical protein
LACPDRGKTGQTNRLALGDLLVNETFPNGWRIAEPAFRQHSRA